MGKKIFYVEKKIEMKSLLIYDTNLNCFLKISLKVCGTYISSIFIHLDRRGGGRKWVFNQSVLIRPNQHDCCF